MPRHAIVRARKHVGTHSLDLTIPASICKELKIKIGDAFEVTGSESSDKAILTYRRIYEESGKEGSNE
jgi:antitoxin component of MazEF toxin-antitoxin module